METMLVYSITNKINGKKYIGVTCKTLRKRWRGHMDHAKDPKRGGTLQNAIRKYGLDAFAMALVYEAVNVREARMVERGLIAQYGTMVPHGYNMTSGGELEVGFRHSPQTKAKLREIGKNHVTPQFIAAVRLMNTARKGVKRDPEIGKKVGATQLGKPQPWNIGRVKSEETRAKLSASIKLAHAEGRCRTRIAGEYSPSEESRRKMSVSAKARAATPEGRADLLHRLEAIPSQKGIAQPRKMVEARAAKLRGKKRTYEQNKAMRAAIRSLSKLSISDVSEIKCLLLLGWGPTQISRSYPVSQSSVSCIKSGKQWSDVPPMVPGFV